MKVGCYAIDISLQGPDLEEYGLPDCVLPFLAVQAAESQPADFQYTISTSAYGTAEAAIPHTPPVAGFSDGPCPYEIYLTASRDYLWVRRDKEKNILLMYQISQDWSTWELLTDLTGSAGEDSFQELAYLFPYSILGKGGVLFHGVVMEWNGSGILVCAHAGVGKTTHTGLWKEQEHAVILNGDRALCCKEKREWYAYGAPWCGSSQEYLNRRVLLNAIVILEQGPVNEAGTLSPLQGALALMELAFAPSFHRELADSAFAAIDDITRSIPVVRLRCRPDKEAVSVLKDALFGR